MAGIGMYHPVSGLDINKLAVYMISDLVPAPTSASMVLVGIMTSSLRVHM
jgi:hypothetical protein